MNFHKIPTAHLIAELVHRGREGFKGEPTRGAAIGAAIYPYLSQSEILDLAAEACEQNNLHNVAGTLRKMANQCRTLSAHIPLN